MFCPHCGTSLPDGSGFCTQCGTRIGAQGAAQQPGNGYGYQQQQQPQDYGYSPQPEFTRQAPYPAPPAANPAPQGFGPINENRDLVTYILLTIVTCGIYGYWFVYTMAQDANIACADDGEETPGLAVYILLSIVTCGIYSYYWQYKLANRLQANGPRYGVTIPEGGSDVLIWYILGTFVCFICSFVGMNILLKNMNTLAAAYNRANGYA